MVNGLIVITMGLYTFFFWGETMVNNDQYWFMMVYDASSWKLPLGNLLHSCGIDGPIWSDDVPKTVLFHSDVYITRGI